MTTHLETRNSALPVPVAGAQKPDFHHAVEARLVVAIIAMLVIGALAFFLYGHASPGI